MLLLTLIAFAIPATAQMVSADTRVEQIEFSQRCVELGSVLRAKKQQPEYLAALKTNAALNGYTTEDAAPIRRRELRVGMSWCAVLASLGRADHVSTRQTAAGMDAFWSYERRGLLVHISGPSPLFRVVSIQTIR